MFHCYCSTTLIYIYSSSVKVICSYLANWINLKRHLLRARALLSMQKMSVLMQVLKTVGLVAFYYCFSISLTFYNKWILTVSAVARDWDASVFIYWALALLIPGLPLSSLHNPDSPYCQVPHCMDSEKTTSTHHRENPCCYRLDRVLEKYISNWYVD